MKLCVPLSDVFRRNRDAILPLVGAVSFKTPSGDTFDGKAQFLESSVNIADPEFPEAIGRAGLLDALGSGRFQSFACDLGPACQVEVVSSPNGYPRYAPLSAPVDVQTYRRTAERNIRFLRECFSGVIKVENLNYFPTGAYETVCSATFIATLARGLGIELLLDVGHARISAANLGISIEDYVDALPFERVSEVQVSGSRVIDGLWEDAHELPSTIDYDVVRSVAARAPVQWLTLEYYRDDRAFVEAYEHLAAERLAMVSRSDPGLVAAQALGLE